MEYLLYPPSQSWGPPFPTVLGSCFRGLWFTVTTAVCSLNMALPLPLWAEGAIYLTFCGSERLQPAVMIKSLDWFYLCVLLRNEDVIFSSCSGIKSLVSTSSPFSSLQKHVATTRPCKEHFRFTRGLDSFVASDTFRLQPSLKSVQSEEKLVRNSES